MADSIHPVRAYRKAQEPPLPLHALAGDIGVTKATLSRIETGDMPLSIELAKKLSARTGIPMSRLLPDLASMFEVQTEAAQ